MCCTMLDEKNKKLLVALATFWWIPGILRGLDIRPDMRHREALVLFAGTGGTFSEILLAFVQR